MRLEYSEKASPLQVKLFSNASIKLSMEFTGMLKYLEDSPNLDLCVSEKIVNIRHINQKISEKTSKQILFFLTSHQSQYALNYPIWFMRDFFTKS